MAFCTVDFMEPIYFNNPVSAVSNGNYVWVANNSYTNSVTIINAKTQSIVRTISNYTNPNLNLGWPHGICYDGSNVWIANLTSIGNVGYRPSPGPIINRQMGVTVIDGSDGCGNYVNNIINSTNPSSGNPDYNSFQYPNSICYQEPDIFVTNWGKFTFTSNIAKINAKNYNTEYFNAGNNSRPTGIASKPGDVYFANMNYNVGDLNIYDSSISYVASPGQTWSVTVQGNNLWTLSSGQGFVRTDLSTNKVKFASLVNTTNSWISSDPSYVWGTTNGASVDRFPIDATLASQVVTFSNTTNPSYGFVSTHFPCLDSSYVWVLDSANQVVVLTNPAGNFVKRITTNIGEPCAGLYADDKRVWMSTNNIPSSGQNGMIKYDLVSKKFSYYNNTLDPSYNFKYQTSITSDGSSIWVGNYAVNVAVNSSITQMDVSSGAFIRNFSTVTGNSKTYTFGKLRSLCSDVSYIWVTDISSDSVIQLDKTNNSLVNYYNNTTNPSYQFLNPASIVSDGSNVWVANSNGILTHMNCKTGAFVSSLNVTSIINNNVFPSYIFPHLATDGSSVCIIYQNLSDFAQFSANATTQTFLQYTNTNAVYPMAIAVQGNYVWMNTIDGIYYVKGINPTPKLYKFNNFNTGGIPTWWTQPNGIFALGDIVFNTNGTKIWSSGWNGLMGINNNLNLCFKEDTKILTDRGYIPVQDLKKGDLVKTVKDGFVPIYAIGKRQTYHPATNDRIKEQLYVYRKGEEGEESNMEDLVITGCHSVLVDDFKNDEEKQKTEDVLKSIYVTDDKYRLPACVDDRAVVYEKQGIHTIYHFALDHYDYYMNYGIYANGLLVETCSIRHMIEISGLEMI
jgi:hypothetical protein